MFIVNLVFIVQYRYEINDVFYDVVIEIKLFVGLFIYYFIIRCILREKYGMERNLYGKFLVCFNDYIQL